MLVGVWDVPDSPVAWTAQGCDQSTLVRCAVRNCETIVRFESMPDHMWLTHRLKYDPQADSGVEEQ
jgi:hypothetical protein